MRAIKIEKYFYKDNLYIHFEYKFNQHRFFKYESNNSLAKNSNKEEFEKAKEYGEIQELTVKNNSYKPTRNKKNQNEENYIVCLNKKYLLEYKLKNGKSNFYWTYNKDKSLKLNKELAEQLALESKGIYKNSQDLFENDIIHFKDFYITSEKNFCIIKNDKYLSNYCLEIKTEGIHQNYVWSKNKDFASSFDWLAAKNISQNIKKCLINHLDNDIIKFK
jgi:hypothetical protein